MSIILANSNQKIRLFSNLLFPRPRLYFNEPNLSLHFCKLSDKKTGFRQIPFLQSWPQRLQIFKPVELLQYIQTPAYALHFTAAACKRKHTKRGSGVNVNVVYPNTFDKTCHHTCWRNRMLCTAQLSIMELGKATDRKQIVG